MVPPDVVKPEVLGFHCEVRLLSDPVVVVSEQVPPPPGVPPPPPQVGSPDCAGTEMPAQAALTASNVEQSVLP